MSSYGYQQARKDQVTNWLMTVCRQKIEEELSNTSKGSVSCCPIVNSCSILWIMLTAGIGIP